MGGDAEAALRKQPNGAHGKRQGHIGQHFAAAEFQDIVSGKGLFGLSPLLLLGGSDCGENQPIVIQPEEAPLLAQIGQLAELSVFIEPEAALVTVLFFIGIGDNKSSFCFV